MSESDVDPVRRGPTRRVAGSDGSELGDWIRRKRGERQLSQRELADRAGLSRSYLCDIERGRGTRPSVVSLDRIGTALGADRTDLLRVAGILEPLMAPEERSRERRLLSVFRGLSDDNQDAIERFARFLLADEQRWVQARLAGDLDEDDGQRSPAQAGPTLFDALEH